MTNKKKLVENLLTAYQSLDHNTMAACYHESAKFADIAFRLDGQKRIHAMWHMICKNGIKVEIQRIEELGDEVHARIVDTYVFSDTNRTVVNPILCRFRFLDGLIVEHIDECNALNWARQAFGGIKGEIAGRIGFLRRRAARKKIRDFVAKAPEYV